MKTSMKNRLCSAVGLGLLLTVGEVKAATNYVSYTNTHPVSLTEWSNNLVLQKFAPALGSLQSVYIEASETIDMSGTVQNTSTGPQSFTFRAGSMLTVTLPGGLGFLQPSPLAVAQAYNLPSMASAPFGPINASDSVNYTYTLPGDMAPFIGTSTIDLPGFTQTQELISGGGGNLNSALNALAGATVTVRYGYVPTPSFAVGLIKAVKPSFSLLSLGTNYQLQVSADLSNWTNQGSPFTATNTSMVYPQYWDVDNWNQLFFRLQVSP